MRHNPRFTNPKTKKKTKEKEKPTAMLLWTTFATFLVAVAAAASIPGAEVEALIDFYRATGGDGWATRDGWGDMTKDPCSGWFGVTCAEGHVNGLFLARNNLVGSIPDTIANLTALSGVDLGCNKLSGPFPASFGTLTQLYAISVRENNLEGPLPFASLCLCILSLSCFQSGANLCVFPSYECSQDAVCTLGLQPL